MMQIVIRCIIMDVSPPTNSDTCASHQIFSSTEHRNCYYNQCVYLASSFHSWLSHGDPIDYI